MNAGLVCHNELLHVLGSHLSNSHGEREGSYPDQALLATLVSKSRAWGCEASLSQALDRALPLDAPHPRADGAIGPSQTATG